MTDQMKAIAMGVHVLDVLVRPVEAIPEGQGGQLVDEIKITAAGSAHDLHTPGYIQELERHSPFRFGFVREHRQYFYASGGLVGRCIAAL